MQPVSPWTAALRVAVLANSLLLSGLYLNWKSGRPLPFFASTKSAGETVRVPPPTVRPSWSITPVDPFDLNKPMFEQLNGSTPPTELPQPIFISNPYASNETIHERTALMVTTKSSSPPIDPNAIHEQVTFVGSQPIVYVGKTETISDTSTPRKQMFITTKSSSPLIDPKTIRILEAYGFTAKQTKSHAMPDSRTEGVSMTGPPTEKKSADHALLGPPVPVPQPRTLFSSTFTSTNTYSPMFTPPPPSVFSPGTKLQPPTLTLGTLEEQTEGPKHQFVDTATIQLAPNPQPSEVLRLLRTFDSNTVFDLSFENPQAAAMVVEAVPLPGSFMRYVAEVEPKAIAKSESAAKEANEAAAKAWARSSLFVSSKSAPLMIESLIGRYSDIFSDVSTYSAAKSKLRVSGTTTATASSSSDDSLLGPPVTFSRPRETLLLSTKAGFQPYEPSSGTKWENITKGPPTLTLGKKDEGVYESTHRFYDPAIGIPNLQPSIDLTKTTAVPIQPPPRQTLMMGTKTYSGATIDVSSVGQLLFDVRAPDLGSAEKPLQLHGSHSPVRQVPPPIGPQPNPYAPYPPPTFHGPFPNGPAPNAPAVDPFSLPPVQR